MPLIRTSIHEHTLEFVEGVQARRTGLVMSNRRIDCPRLKSDNPIASNNLRTEAESRATHNATLSVEPEGQTVQLDPDLQRVIDAWPALPEAIRAGIVALVNTATQSR